MAITQVTQYNSVPTVVGDYAAQNKHIQAFINQVNNHSFILTDPTATTIPAIALGTYISHGGTLFLVDTANYTILGSVASGNNYIKMSVSGTTLTATWIQNISAYTYNPIYGYLASGTDMILPYLVTYDGSSVYTKYRNDFNNVSLPSLTLSGSFLPRTATQYNTGSIAVSGELILPRGLYIFGFNTYIGIYAYINGSWEAVASDYGPIISDGTNVKISNLGGTLAQTFYALKF